jgi:hypothetical protein
VPEEKPLAAQVERWVALLGSVIAPATLIGTLLFYFGYVSSRAQYDYFGIDVDVVGLSTQDYVMRSPQPLLVPLVVMALLGAGLVALHTRIRRHCDAPGFERSMRRSIAVGLAFVAVSVGLLLAYPLLAGWDPYPLVTPVVLGVGAAVAAYGVGTLRFLHRRRVPTDAADHSPPRVAVMVLLWAAVAACAFWATATLAQWSGLGLARHQANNLDDLPSVVVDTRERLFLPDEAEVVEMGLPAADGSTYRYRYWGLRLLVVGEDHLYLVPNTWNNHDTTLVLPYGDDSVRVQFQFRNIEP